MATIREQVGSLVRLHRNQAGLSQAELAEQSDRSLELVGRVERGAVGPSLETLEAFARVLGVEVGDFFRIGPYQVKASDDPLPKFIQTLAELDVADLSWAEELLRVALSRGRRRR